MIAALTALLLVAAPPPPEPLVEKYLVSGKLAEGEKALVDALAANGRADEIRFGLGMLQFVRAVETTAQAFYKHGLHPDPFGGNLPFLRLPIPPNPHPEPMTYEALRAILGRWVDDLGKAEATLSQVDDDVKLPLHFGTIRIDLDGDGKHSDDEALWKLYSRMNAGLRNVTEEQASNFVIAFDGGDALWLRGYCHLLMATAELYLAHDGQALFDHSAHLFFANPKIPFSFLKSEKDPQRRFDVAQISDDIAFVHELRFTLKEPARMQSVLKHLETMIDLSRQSWKAYLAETDDDHEWIPNPKQHSVLPNGRVTDEMVKGWTTFLDEAEKVLQGKLLVPFWRDADGRGVNLRRAFTEPRDLDVVLWFQGTGAAPYLEKGPVTEPETWRRLQRIFQGEFVGFAFWFN